MSDHMTPERLAQIQERLDAATEGPWEMPDYAVYEDHDECCIELMDDTIELSRHENAAFIIAARTDIPDLLAEVRRLAAEVIAAKDVTRAAGDQCSEAGNTITQLQAEMWEMKEDNTRLAAELAAEKKRADAAVHALKKGMGQKYCSGLRMQILAILLGQQEGAEQNVHQQNQQA